MRRKMDVCIYLWETISCKAHASQQSLLQTSVARTWTRHDNSNAHARATCTVCSSLIRIGTTQTPSSQYKKLGSSTFVLRTYISNQQEPIGAYLQRSELEVTRGEMNIQFELLLRTLDR